MGEDFWGRHDEVDQMWRAVERGSVLLSAPRRYGKSSLMHQLQREPRDPWRVVLVDLEFVQTPAQFVEKVGAGVLANDPLRTALQGAASLPGQVQRWFQGLVSDVKLGAAGIGDLAISVRSAMAADASKWPEQADDLLALVGADAAPVLIVLDEFPMMIDNMLREDSEAAVRFLRWFRSVRQQRGDGNLCFVLGGSVDIEPRLLALGQDKLLNDLQRFRLRPWSLERATEFAGLVLQSEGVPFAQGVHESPIEALESGVPFYVQVMLEVARGLARREARSLQAADALAICQQHLLGPEHKHLFAPYQQRLASFGRLERGCRLVLAELAGRGPLAESVLASALEREQVRVDLHDVLLILEENYYVCRDRGQVRFADALVRAWWRRNVPGVPR